MLRFITQLVIENGFPTLLGLEAGANGLLLEASSSDLWDALDFGRY